MTHDRPVEILIALGANLPSRAGPPAQTLQAALGMLAARGVEIRKVSAFRQTPAWPEPNDPPFTNAAAALATSLQPLALMTLLHEVEAAFGRVRSARNAPRTLDLDLLDYGGLVLEEGDLRLPHPAIAGRRFVLEPLAEIAPHWRHPVTGQDIAALLAALPAGS